MQEEMDLFEKQQAVVSFDEDRRSPAKIVVFGIGGAGGNALNRMVEAEIKGVELIAANTDIQALRASLAPTKLEIGMKLTGGLGCGGDPQLGQKAAMEDAERILELLKGADMVFLVGGEGGGTFTGAAPVFAGIASDAGALTIAMVTMPFGFQGAQRRKYADSGIRELRTAVDAMIVVPNERLLRAMDENALLEDSFRFADNLLCQAVLGISELITKSGIINPDLADVRTVMRHKGLVVIGTAIAEGPNRAADAAQLAISSPLLADTPITGAKAALVNIIGSRYSLKLHEVESAAGIVKEKAGLEDLILGAMYDEKMGERVKVTVIATGLSQDGSQYSEDSGSIDTDVEIADSIASSSHPESFWEDLDRPAYTRRRAG